MAVSSDTAHSTQINVVWFVVDVGSDDDDVNDRNSDDIERPLSVDYHYLRARSRDNDRHFSMPPHRLCCLPGSLAGSVPLRAALSAPCISISRIPEHVTPRGYMSAKFGSIHLHAVVLNHISSRLLIPLSDSSLSLYIALTLTRHFGHYNRYYV